MYVGYWVCAGVDGLVEAGSLLLLSADSDDGCTDNAEVTLGV